MCSCLSSCWPSPLTPASTWPSLHPISLPPWIIKSFILQGPFKVKWSDMLGKRLFTLPLLAFVIYLFHWPFTVFTSIRQSNSGKMSLHCQWRKKRSQSKIKVAEDGVTWKRTLCLWIESTSGLTVHGSRMNLSPWSWVILPVIVFHEEKRKDQSFSEWGSLRSKESGENEKSDRISLAMQTHKDSCFNFK